MVQEHTILRVAHVCAMAAKYIAVDRGTIRHILDKLTLSQIYHI